MLFFTFQVKSKKTEIQFGVNPFMSTQVFETVERKPPYSKPTIRKTRTYKPNGSNVSKNPNDWSLKTPKIFNDKFLNLLSVNKKTDISTDKSNEKLHTTKPPKYPNNKLHNTISGLTKLQNEASLLALSYSFGENLYIPSYFKSRSNGDIDQIKHDDDKSLIESRNIPDPVNVENFKSLGEPNIKKPLRHTMSADYFPHDPYIVKLDDDHPDRHFGSILKRPGKKRTSIKHVEFLDNLSVRQFESDYDSSGRQY